MLSGEVVGEQLGDVDGVARLASVDDGLQLLDSHHVVSVPYVDSIFR